MKLTDKQKVALDIWANVLCWIVCIFATIYFGAHWLNFLFSKILEL